MPINHDSLLRILLAERARVLGYIRAIVRRREMAEDIFQDVCVLALEKRDQIADEQHLAAWLRLTSRWIAMNALRKHQNRQKSLDDSVLAQLDVEWASHDDTPGAAMSDALRSCLETLSDKAKAMVTSRYTDGQSFDEISRRTARPVNSLYVTFSRIHTALADCMDRKLLREKGGHA